MNLTDEEMERFYRIWRSYTSRGKAAPTMKILDKIIQQRNKLQNGKG